MSSNKQTQVVKHFEESAKTYAKAYEGNTSEAYGFNVRKRIVSRCLPVNCGKTLDIGCGPGIMVDVLLPKIELYKGIDSADTMIKECQKKYSGNPQLSFEISQAEHINVESGFFDTVICMGVIEYVFDDRVPIKEISRVTRKGGTVIITLPNKWSPYRVWRRVLYVPLRHFIKYTLCQKEMPLGEQIVHREYTYRNFKSILKEYNLYVECVSYYDYHMLPSPLDKKFSRLNLRLIYKLERLSASCLKWLGTGMVIKIIKG